MVKVNILELTKKIVSELGGGPAEEEYVRAVLKTIAGETKDLYRAENFDLNVYGGVLYRKMLLSGIGEAIKSHKHVYDHWTFVHKGTVDINGVIYHEGQFAQVPKDVIHTIKAITMNCEVYCIHSEYEAMLGVDGQDQINKEVMARNKEEEEEK